MLHILIGKLIGMSRVDLKVHFIFEIRIFVTQMVDREFILALYTRLQFIRQKSRPFLS